MRNHWSFLSSIPTSSIAFVACPSKILTNSLTAFALWHYVIGGCAHPGASRAADRAVRLFPDHLRSKLLVRVVVAALRAANIPPRS